MDRVRKKGDTGRFEDPDLVPVMNLVCVLIPLVLWTTTWVAYGQITVTRGGTSQRGSAGGEQPKKLRLVAVLDRGAITLLADRAASSRVFPEAGGKPVGRIDIPRRATTLEAIGRERAACTPPAAPGGFDDCAYWQYVERFVRICYEDPGGVVPLPDLKRFHEELAGIRDRVETQLGDEVDDGRVLHVKTADDVPYCEVVALMDFARLRRFDLDWSADEQFQAGVDEALRHGVVDPLQAPSAWNEVMERELLFPIVQFVD